MNKQSNSYIIIYSIVMVVIVATLLSFTAMNLKGRQDANVELEKKGNILESVNLLEVKAGEDKNAIIVADYDKYITKAMLINRKGEVLSNNAADAFKVFINLAKEYAKPEAEQTLPLFVASMPTGGDKFIFPVNGTGLWGPIWGYVALDANLNTIFGVVFDHASETPGLGAEITTAKFKDQFKGKGLFEGSEFVGIKAVKGTAAGTKHDIDAVTGGTITSRAVEDMIRVSMGAYEKYLVNNQVK